MTAAMEQDVFPPVAARELPPQPPPRSLPWWTPMALPFAHRAIRLRGTQTIGHCWVRVLEAEGLVAYDHGGTTSHPFAEIAVGQHVVATKATRAIRASLTPVWDEAFVFAVQSPFATIRCTVWHDAGSHGPKAPLGEVVLPLALFADGRAHDLWLNLRPCGAMPGEKGIRQILQATDALTGTSLAALAEGVRPRLDVPVPPSAIAAMPARGVPPATEPGTPATLHGAQASGAAQIAEPRGVDPTVTVEHSPTGSMAADALLAAASEPPATTQEVALGGVDIGSGPPSSAAPVTTQGGRRWNRWTRAVRNALTLGRHSASATSGVRAPAGGVVDTGTGITVDMSQQPQHLAAEQVVPAAHDRAAAMPATDMLEAAGAANRHHADPVTSIDAAVAAAGMETPSNRARAASAAATPVHRFTRSVSNRFRHRSRTVGVGKGAAVGDGSTGSHGTHRRRHHNEHVAIVYPRAGQLAAEHVPAVRTHAVPVSVPVPQQLHHSNTQLPETAGPRVRERAASASDRHMQSAISASDRHQHRRSDSQVLLQSYSIAPAGTSVQAGHRRHGSSSNAVAGALTTLYSADAPAVGSEPCPPLAADATQTLPSDFPASPYSVPPFSPLSPSVNPPSASGVASPPPIETSTALVHDYALGRLHVQVQLNYDETAEFWSHGESTAVRARCPQPNPPCTRSFSLWLLVPVPAVLHYEQPPLASREPFSMAALVNNWVRLYNLTAPAVWNVTRDFSDAVLWQNPALSLWVIAVMIAWTWKPWALPLLLHGLLLRHVIVARLARDLRLQAEAQRKLLLRTYAAEGTLGINSVPLSAVEDATPPITSSAAVVEPQQAGAPLLSEHGMAVRHWQLLCIPPT